MRSRKVRECLVALDVSRQMIGATMKSAVAAGDGRQNPGGAAYGAAPVRAGSGPLHLHRHRGEVAEAGRRRRGSHADHVVALSFQRLAQGERPPCGRVNGSLDPHVAIAGIDAVGMASGPPRDANQSSENRSRIAYIVSVMPAMMTSTVEGVHPMSSRRCLRATA